MEWDAKTPSPWDWDNLALFCGKVSEPPKPLQPAVECRIEAARKIGHGHAHGGGGIFPYGAAAGSCSNLGNRGSSKSSVSASVDSSAKAAVRLPQIDFEAIDGFSRTHTKNKEFSRIEDTGTSPTLLEVVNHKEPIGLKLGKRTYFEDVCIGSNDVRSSPSALVGLPSASPKKSRTSQQNIQNSYCQVDGCNIDLTNAKGYHRKHRVCEEHSKSPNVIVAGQERRFCQQCSRFHELSEFDQKKRSCRRRLSDHNARRRKPQSDTISFNSGRPSLSCYDNNQQMNLLWNKALFGHMKPDAIAMWDGLYDFKLTQARGSWIKPTKARDTQLHFPSAGVSSNVSAIRHDPEGLLPFKGTTAEVPNQGPEASAVASNLEGAPDLRRALSLLSTDSWGSAEPRPTSVHFSNIQHSGAGQESALHAIGAASGFWQEGQPFTSQQLRILSFDSHNDNNTNQIQEFQLLKTPFEAALLDSGSLH